MVISDAIKLPPLDEVKIRQELPVSQPALRAGAFHLGKYCEFQSKEFMLCRQEMRDPRKCLKEGADVTACGLEFFQKVKKNCRDEFTRYMHCIDCDSSYHLNLQPCRPIQRVFDKCMLEKLNLERPPIGYHSRPKVHDSKRPPPEPEKLRDWNAEAEKLGAKDELPQDYKLENEYRRYQKQGVNPFMQ